MAVAHLERTGMADDHAIPISDPAHLKFGPSGGFQRALRQRVEQYFRDTGLKQRDCPQMYLKTTVILAWLIASYVFLVFVASSAWTAAPAALSLGLSIAAVGFCIQHDGNHHAYSNRRWVNSLMAHTIDLIGGSSYNWARKHNVIHHSYANITGADDDINIGLLGRLSPHQRRLFFHRLQHFYIWPLYGFLTLKWHFFDDFRDLATGRIAGHKFPRPRGWDLASFILGKATYFTLALGIPLMLHNVWAVLLFYTATQFVLGLLLSVVFQLAHCVEEANFPMPRADTGRIEHAWAEHQVETTVDFARDNRLLSWYVGGLNFQIEHHLFPQICHVHYAKLAPLVEQTCNEFGLKYQAHKTFRAGVVSHFRLLRRMGKPNPVAA